MTSLASVFKDPGNEEKDGLVSLDTTVMVPLPSSLEYIIWSGVTASVNKRFLVVVVLGGLFEIRDHTVDAVVIARILEASLVFLILNGGERKLLHVVDVARTSTELELAPAATDAALQTIAHFCVSSKLKNALLRLGCCEAHGVGVSVQTAKSWHAIRAAYAFSRISGMAAERPTPYNQDAADALKLPEIIWNSSTRAELLKFVDQKREASAPDGSHSLNDSQVFLYEALSKEILIGNVGLNHEKLELASNKDGKLYGEEKITEDPVASSDGNLIDKEI
ncbi:hypothetical protein Tco_0891196 [Tanacetum coccineum]|uniref:Uncharacterized protein n=1 Tax=Tanacetum coccineum TaxID=301880 RepID=A0ABQ5C414_9ASTR